MATTSQNNVIKPGRQLEYPLTQGTDWNQGDLLYCNTNIATVATSDSHCQYLIGVAVNASPMDPAPYGTAVYPKYAEVDFGGVYSMKTTAGESYTHAALVGIGADSQTVSTTTGTYPVGSVYNPEGTTITGASGTNIRVRIFNRFDILGKLI